MFIFQLKKKKKSSSKAFAVSDCSVCLKFVDFWFCSAYLSFCFDSWALISLADALLSNHAIETL